MPLRFFPLLRVVPHEQTQSEQASVIEEKYSALSKMYDAWIARTWTLSRSISSFFPTIRSLWIPLFAIAHELGYDPDEIMNEFDQISAEIPHIASVNPASYIYDCEDFYKAGGIPEVMKKLREHLDLSVMTVTGKTMEENINTYINLYPDNQDLIRDMDNPHTTLGGIAIMRGNLAPDTGVSKPAAIHESVRRFTGKAVCFDSQEDCVKALEQCRIKKGDVVVVRYEGPKGGPGMREMYAPLKMLNGQGLALDTALITDGRVSGTNNGCYVVHVSPEAAVGGLLCRYPLLQQQSLDIIGADNPCAGSAGDFSRIANMVISPVGSQNQIDFFKIRALKMGIGIVIQKRIHQNLISRPRGNPKSGVGQKLKCVTHVCTTLSSPAHSLGCRRLPAQHTGPENRP